MKGFADYSDAELDRFVSWGLNVVRLDLMEDTVRRLGDRDAP